MPGDLQAHGDNPRLNLAGRRPLFADRLIHVIGKKHERARHFSMSDLTMIAIALAMSCAVLILAFAPGRIWRALAVRAETKRRLRRRH